MNLEICLISFLLSSHHIWNQEEVKKNEYKPGFTNDDLMKLVFQRYGRTMKREALESAPEDEEDNYQNYEKRAYPRQIPGSNSLLARYTDVCI